MNIAVHGLGYVGLTAAFHFARAGADVIGFDPDEEVVRAFNARTPKQGEFLGYLAEAPDGMGYKAGRATANFADTLDADAHIIAVPTEKDGEPYDDIVFEVLYKLWGGAKDNAIILIESTLTPNSVDRWLQDVGPHRACRTDRPSGVADRALGENIFLAVCPRRDWFADPDKNLKTLPRVVGGYTDACTQRAVEVLSLVSDEILTTDYRTAEITKSLENAFLHVPIMFACQLAVALPNHNIAKAVELAGTHWRLPQLYLNAGTGGRCVPLGTKYLLEAAKDRRGIIWGMSIGDAAVEFEDSMRAAVARAVYLRTREMPGRPRTLVLGVAYRPEFRDAGMSPGLGVAKKLRLVHGADVSVHDPMWSLGELRAIADPIPPVKPGDKFTALVLATPHRFYLDSPPSPWGDGVKLIVDCTGAWSEHREMFAERGIEYVRVGEPGWLPQERKETT